MIGGTLGPYRLDRELGAGGMGKVYAATVAGRCPGLAEGTRVALKVVHPHLLETPGFFKRFLREAEIGKSVVHENVVRTYDCDAVMSGGAQQNFLVMEYVEGQTLRSLLAELERVPEELCRHIGREVAKGLAAIHAAGVVHRDMKPENVLITKDHAVKVMDLGVARLNDEALRLSQTGAFVGSIHYAAPECFREGGKHVDGRADLHALGLVLYELAGGVNPYLADDVPQILRKVLHEEPRKLGDVNPQLSPFFEEVVHTLLAKKADERFADANALLLVLEAGEKSEWWRSRAKAIRAETHRPLRRIRIPRETAVYGREIELTKLRALFEKAKAGDGQVVLLEGEAGIGKSRLVDELVGRLQRDGEPVNFLFGSYPPDGAATAAGALSTAFREQIGDADIGPYLPQTPLFVPAFEALLRGDAAPSGCEQLTRDSSATCFVQALRALAAERPTLLLVDDLHFASEDSRGMFTSLALAVPGHRILLVGTTRPGADEKWLAGLTRLPQTSQMTLIRLGPKDLLALLKDSLRSESLALALAGQIAQKSDGNPFFAFEIIRGLREGQFITQRDDGTWVSTRVIDDIRIPSSVLDLVNARVADLSEEERDLLDVAACWGFEFDATLVGDSLGLARVPTLKRFAQVEKKHRLVRCAGERFAFDHHQVQEALYGALPPQLAREYHAALAAALEARTKAAEKDPETLEGVVCVDLCEHFLKAARGESALRYLKAAQAHLSTGYLNAQVIALSERALAMPGLLASAERAKALLRLAGANGPLDMLGRRVRQEECAREAERLAEEAGDDDLRAQAAGALGAVFWRGSRHGAAEAAFRRALDLAQARGDRKAEAAATGNLGSVFAPLGRLAEAKEHLERHLALSREIGDRQGEAAATGNLGNVFYSLGRLAEAKEHHERRAALSRETGDRRGEVIAQLNLAGIHREEGELARSAAGYEACLLMAAETGLRHLQAVTLCTLGSLRADVGDATRGRESLAAGRDLAREIGAPGYEVLARCELSLLPGGDPADALAACAEHEERLSAGERLEARLLLWKATRDRAHLVEAKRLLDEATAHVDEESRGLMLTKLRMNREIVEACKAEGIE